MGEAIITRRGGGGGGKFERFETLITATGTTTIPYKGLYRITAIGKGASGYSVSRTGYAGGAGGGGYLETNLSADTTLSVTLASSYIAASIGGSEIIRATNGTENKAGTASGTGVIPFASNGTVTTSISPPACYNSDRYISIGGEGGYSSNGTSAAAKSGGDGGNGLFGGDGPMGGHVVGGTYLTVTPPVATPRNGAGASGLGSSATATATSYLGGGGGGGGYGGGGGKADVGGTYSNPRPGNHGQGGAACVFIERIG